MYSARTLRGERAVVVVVRDGTGAVHDDRTFERSGVCCMNQIVRLRCGVSRAIVGGLLHEACALAPTEPWVSALHLYDTCGTTRLLIISTMVSAGELKRSDYAMWKSKVLEAPFI